MQRRTKPFNTYHLVCIFLQVFVSKKTRWANVCGVNLSRSHQETSFQRRSALRCRSGTKMQIPSRKFNQHVSVCFLCAVIYFPSSSSSLFYESEFFFKKKKFQVVIGFFIFEMFKKKKKVGFVLLMGARERAVLGGTALASSFWCCLPLPPSFGWCCLVFSSSLSGGAWFPSPF